MCHFAFNPPERLVELFDSNALLVFSCKSSALFILQFNLYELKTKAKDIE